MIDLAGPNYLTMIDLAGPNYLPIIDLAGLNLYLVYGTKGQNSHSENLFSFYSCLKASIGLSNEALRAG
jgi:hypothetical protein